MSGVTSLAEYEAVFERQGVPIDLRVPSEYFFETITYTVRTPAGSEPAEGPSLAPEAGQEVTEVFAIPRHVYLHPLPPEMVEIAARDTSTPLYRAWIGEMDDGGRAVALSAHVDPEALLSQGTVVHAGSKILGKSILRHLSSVGNNSVIKDSRVGEGTRIAADCSITEASLGALCKIGNEVGIRVGTEIKENVVIGDNTTLGNNTKVSADCQVGPNNSIYSNVSLGKGVTTQETCELSNDVIVESWAKLASDVHIKDGAKVRREASVGPSNIIGCGAIVGEYVMTAQDCRVGDGAEIESYCRLATAVVIGAEVHLATNVSVENRARVEDNARVGSGSTLGERSVVGENTVLESIVTLDSDSHSGDNSTLRERSRVLNSTRLKDGTTLKMAELAFDGGRYSKTVKVH